MTRRCTVCGKRYSNKRFPPYDYYGDIRHGWVCVWCLNAETLREYTRRKGRQIAHRSPWWREFYGAKVRELHEAIRTRCTSRSSAVYYLDGEQRRNADDEGRSVHQNEPIKVQQ